MADEQDQRWRERCLLDGPFDREPRLQWHLDLGDLRAAHGMLHPMRVGPILVFAVQNDWGSALVGVDSARGTVAWQTKAPASRGVWRVDDRAVVARGRRAVMVVDSRDGRTLATWEAPGELIDVDVRDDVFYALSHRAQGDPEGNAQLSFAPLGEFGSWEHVVVQLTTKPRTPGYSSCIGIQHEPDGLVHFVVNADGLKHATVAFDPQTRTVQVEEWNTDRPDPADEIVEDWGDGYSVVVRPEGVDAGYSISGSDGEVLATGSVPVSHQHCRRLGEQARTVLIAGETVYDKATGQALWSSPALVEVLERRPGLPASRPACQSAVDAVIGDFLVAQRRAAQASDAEVFDLRTGRLLWQRSSPDRYRQAIGSMWLTDLERLIWMQDSQRDESSGVVAVDLATGEEAWRITPPGDERWIQKLDGKLLVVGESAITLYEPGGGG